MKFLRDVRVQKLHAEAKVPGYQSAGAAGLDLAACLPSGSLTIDPGRIAKVPTGIALAIPDGFEGQVRARSGLSSTHGIAPVNSPGTIDSDYRGEVLVPLINHGEKAFVVEHGMRIAQLVIAPVARVTVVEVGELESTDRGRGGFGSTGSA